MKKASYLHTTQKIQHPRPLVIVFLNFLFDLIGFSTAAIVCPVVLLILWAAECIPLNESTHVSHYVLRWFCATASLLLFVSFFVLSNMVLCVYTKPQVTYEASFAVMSVTLLALCYGVWFLNSDKRAISHLLPTALRRYIPLQFGWICHVFLEAQLVRCSIWCLLTSSRMQLMDF